jgi:hypothetical protein
LVDKKVKLPVYRAAVSTHIVFDIIFGIPIAAVAANWRRPGAGPMIAMIAVADALCFVWIARSRIVITEETLYFRSLFASSEVTRRAIRTARVVVRPSRTAEPLRLVVKCDGGGKIDINAKMFSGEAIAVVLTRTIGGLAPPSMVGSIGDWPRVEG